MPANPYLTRLTASADPSATAIRENVTQWNWDRNLAVDDAGALHVVWTQLGTTDIQSPADRPDPVDTTQLPIGQIFYKRSLDGGHTWSDDLALTARTVGTDSPSVATSGSSVYVVWRAVDGNRLRVFFQSSADEGATWSAPVAVSDNPTGVSTSAPSLAAVGDSLYVAWPDGRPQMVGAQVATTKEVYMATSTNRGQSWSAAQSVSIPDAFSSYTVAVAAAADAVHVAWTDERNDVTDCMTAGNSCAEEEYYRRFDVAAGTWGTETRLTFDAAGSPKPSWAPSIAVSQGTVHLAFFDARTGPFQVYYKRSLDGGATWQSDVLLGPAQAMVQAARPTIAALDGDVHLVWFTFSDFPADVFYSRSSDNGATWSTPLNLTNDGPTAAARLPHVAVAPDHAAHVLFYDTRNSDASGAKVELYYARPGG